MHAPASWKAKSISFDFWYMNYLGSVLTEVPLSSNSITSISSLCSPQLNLIIVANPVLPTWDNLSCLLCDIKIDHTP